MAQNLEGVVHPFPYPPKGATIEKSHEKDDSPTSSSPPTTANDQTELEASRTKPVNKFDFGFIPIPQSLRTDRYRHGAGVSLVKLALFGICATVTVASLYWSPPILPNIRTTFGVSSSEVARIPTLVQGGYAAGMLLISPLGDLIRRRQLILCLIVISTFLALGCAVTKNFIAFEVLNFLLGMTSITPQILIIIVADMVPAEKRAGAISVVFSGLLLGVLLARFLAGLIANFSDWRNAYWLATALLGSVGVISWSIIPDLPDKGTGLTYFGILWTMLKFAVTEPVLVNCCLTMCLSYLVFGSFFTTLAFLLESPPYNYNELVIGVFGLVGIVGVVAAPFVGRTLDKLVLWVGVMIGLSILLLGQVVQTIGGGLNAAAIVICIICLDLGMQIEQLSHASRIFMINPIARARLNAVFVISIFVGQTVGSAVGSAVYLDSGWRANAGMCAGFVGAAMLVTLARGPHSKKWLGWDGGHALRKVPKDSSAPKVDIETAEGTGVVVDVDTVDERPTKAGAAHTETSIQKHQALQSTI